MYHIIGDVFQDGAGGGYIGDDGGGPMPYVRYHGYVSEIHMRGMYGRGDISEDMSVGRICMKRCGIDVSSI